VEKETESPGDGTDLLPPKQKRLGWGTRPFETWVWTSELREARGWDIARPGARGTLQCRASLFFKC